MAHGRQHLQNSTTFDYISIPLCRELNSLSNYIFYLRLWLHIMSAQLTEEPPSAPISPISRSGSNSSMPDTLDESINLQIYRENERGYQVTLKGTDSFM